MRSFLFVDLLYSVLCITYSMPYRSRQCPNVVPMLSLCCPLLSHCCPIVVPMLSLYCRRVVGREALLLGRRVTDRGRRVTRRFAARSLVCGSSYDRDLFVKPAVDGFQQPLVRFTGIYLCV